MARSYKRDKIGRFASTGGGGQVSKGLTDRKQAVVKQVSRDTLAGKKVSPARKNYAKAQSAAKLAAEASQAGKGNKAARRAAAPKPAAKPKASKSHLAGIEKARASGRKRGAQIAAKVSARNAYLDRLAKAYGG